MKTKIRRKKPIPIPVVLELLRLKLFEEAKPKPQALRIYGVIGRVAPKEDAPKKGA